MNSTAIATNNEKPQMINFGADYTVPICSKEVIINCKAGIHNHGCSNVKLINRIDYNWEMKHYHGQLVSVHIGGKLLAYAMKGKDGGMVRLVNQETNQRALIKNLKTDVRDVSFAFLRNELILGCVDDTANVFIYEIEDSPHHIKYQMLLKIQHPGSIEANLTNYRMIWCPYLPSIDDDTDTTDETAKMFVFLNGSKAEVWDVCTTIAKYQSDVVQPDEDNEGYVEINHSQNLVDVSFSSDGTAIATACLDGCVKFYQIYLADNEKQKQLHEWVPHEGKPLSCLIFIDNILEYSSDSRFWKFAITGAFHNSELKLWSCETWTCLQTIHFKIDPTIENLVFKIGIDHSGQYVVMSDITNKVLYVLKIERNDAEKLVMVKNISQFLLPAPFLSFHITKAELKKTCLDTGSIEDLYDVPDYDDEEEETDLNSVNINLMVIQPKKFQECNIMFAPSRVNASKFNDGANKTSLEKALSEENLMKLDDLQSSVSLLIKQHKSQLNLLSPDDFAPIAKSRSNSVRNSMEAATVQQDLAKNSVDDLLEFDEPAKGGNFASGGSSPSREVQEILSLNNSTYSNTEYYETLSNLPEPSDSSSTKETIWPKIPVLRDEVPAAVTDNEEVISTKSQVHNDVDYRLVEMQKAIRAQTLQIEKLRLDISDSERKLTENLNEVSKGIDATMSKHHVQIIKLLENMLSVQNERNRQMQEDFMNNMSQFVNKSLSDKIQQIISHELKHAILPSTKNLMENMKHQLEYQFNQKSNQVDSLLKDHISDIVKSKALTESIGQFVSKAIAPTLEKSYREMITHSLIPSWEKICANMFQQINHAFTQGTKEYTSWVENYLENQKMSQEKGKDLLVQINSATENLSKSSDQLINSVGAEIRSSMNLILKSMQDKMVANVKEIICEEVRMGFKLQASVIEDSLMNAVRSRSVTPASHVDSHVIFNKIQHCLSLGQVEEALKLALSAENLQYVVYVCDKVDVHTIFESSITLPQSCLLSLIQQLGVDLAQNTDVKLGYIHAAILGLDHNDKDTKRFASKILRELTVQLKAFIASNPPYAQKSSARILSMAIENIGPSFVNVNV